MNSTSADNRTSLIVLIFSYTIFVISLFLMEWDALSTAYYGIHEIVSVIFGLSFFVLPIVAIVWLLDGKSIAKKGSINRHKLDTIYTIFFTDYFTPAPVKAFLYRYNCRKCRSYTLNV